MIKRLGLFTNNAETELTGALVDKSHEKIKFSQLRKIYKSIANQKYMGNILSAMRKNFKSSSYTLRIKSLIVLHYFIKKTIFQHERMLVFAETELNEMKEKKNVESTARGKKVELQNQQKEYVQKNIIQFYVLYLLKYMAHSEAYSIAKQAGDNSHETFGITLDLKLSKTSETTSETKVTSEGKIFVEERTLMSHINIGFEILNLINFIIQSQESFNKMGRYYIQHQQIMNLFIMYLDDLTIYNNYTKKLAKMLTKSINHIKEQQIKHCFLYLTESQKTSDRLYEFYYNRYYYSKVKKLICMPTFLTIDNDDFERVVKEIKKVDKELVSVVKESKYSQEYKMNKTIGCFTEPDFKPLPQSVQQLSSKLNRTMMTETGHNHLKTINTTLQHLSSIHKSKRQVVQNITRYIQTFDDIDDDIDEHKLQEEFI